MHPSKRKRKTGRSRKQLSGLTPSDLVTMALEVDSSLDEDDLLSYLEQFIDAYAHNTWLQFANNARAWLDYLYNRGLPLSQVSALDIRDYFDRDAGIEEPPTLATVDARLYGIRKLFAMCRLEDPLASTREAVTLKAIRNRAAQVTVKKAAPLLLDKLEAILNTLDPDVPADARDGALFYMCYDAMLRRSEVVAIRYRDIFHLSNGSGRLQVGRSKTDQHGRGERLYLSTSAMFWVDRWIRQRITIAPDDPVFISLAPKSDGKTALSDRDVNRILKRRARAAGVNIEGLSGHSFRVGAAHDMALNGASNPGMMLAGRWRSDRMPKEYIRDIDLENGEIAKLHRARQRAEEDPDSTVRGPRPGKKTR